MIPPLHGLLIHEFTCKGEACKKGSVDMQQITLEDSKWRVLDDDSNTNFQRSKLKHEDCTSRAACRFYSSDINYIKY